MSDAPAPDDPLDEARIRIARLEKRLAREREARRQAEEISERGMRELWLANCELDARVDERTRTLADALEELQVAKSARDQFLSTVSHEIRTPLNGVLGMLELIPSHVSSDQGLRYVEAATESADRLHGLVSRLLDMVELDSGKFNTHRSLVDPARVGDNLRQRWQRPALQSGHLLTVSCSGAAVEIDETRVMQILNEFVDNAVTHSTPGAIRVEIRNDGEAFVATVIDSGPGIDPEKIPELLTADFAMVDASTARVAQGLGLGLGICRRIAEAMGGTLDISSDGTSSSASTLSLPHTTNTCQQQRGKDQ